MIGIKGSKSTLEEMDKDTLIYELNRQNVKLSYITKSKIYKCFKLNAYEVVMIDENGKRYIIDFYNEQPQWYPINLEKELSKDDFYKRLKERLNFIIKRFTSIDHLAQELDMTKRNLYYYLNGNQKISIDVLFRICNVLNISIMNFIWPLYY